MATNSESQSKESFRVSPTSPRKSNLSTRSPAQGKHSTDKNAANKATLPDQIANSQPASQKPSMIKLKKS